MPLSLITLADTFFTWLTRTNQLVTINNLLTEGAHNTTGTITITNPSGISGNVSLNVANGLIRGDAGLITNVRASVLSGSITNSQMQNNRINIVSNSTSLTVFGGNAFVGNTVFLSLPVSTNPSDTSAINVAATSIVNTSRSIAISAFDSANAVSAIANSGNSIATGAFGQANAAFVRANIAIANTNFVNTAVQAAYGQANAAYDRANVANTIAIASYNSSNTINTTAQLAAARANANDQIFIYVAGSLDPYTTEKLIPKVFQPFRIDGAWVELGAGSITLTFQKSGATIGNGGDIVVSTTGTYYTFHTNNTFDTSSTLSIAISNNTSADEDLSIVLNVQRTEW